MPIHWRLLAPATAGFTAGFTIGFIAGIYKSLVCWARGEPTARTIRDRQSEETPDSWLDRIIPGITLTDCKPFMKWQLKSFPEDSRCGYRVSRSVRDELSGKDYYKLTRTGEEITAIPTSEQQLNIQNTGENLHQELACPTAYEYPIDVLIRFTYCDSKILCERTAGSFMLLSLLQTSALLTSVVAINMLETNKMNDAEAEQGIIVSSFRGEDRHMGGFYNTETGIVVLYTGLFDFKRIKLAHELSHKVTHILFDSTSTRGPELFASTVIKPYLACVAKEHGLEFGQAWTAKTDYTPMEIYDFGKKLSYKVPDSTNTSILDNTNVKWASGIFGPFTSSLYDHNDLTTEMIAYTMQSLVFAEACVPCLKEFYIWLDNEVLSLAKEYIESSPCCANIKDYDILAGEITCQSNVPCSMTA